MLKKLKPMVQMGLKFIKRNDLLYRVPSVAHGYVTGGTAHNGTVCASAPFGRSGGSVRLGRCAPTAHSAHIFAVAGNLRFPLSQPQKRRIPPERYAQFWQKVIKKFDKNKNTWYYNKKFV
jgi:hypothetical protein